jgi:hypothetical protein
VNNPSPVQDLGQHVSASVVGDAVTTLVTVPVEGGDYAGIEFQVVGKRTDGTPDGGYYVKHVLVKRVAGAPVLVGQTDLVAIEDAVAWAVTADINGNDLRLRVQGVLGATIEWTCWYIKRIVN